jgi:hypothetical protein
MIARNSAAVFQPGDSVPRPGQYWIRHQQHRLAHLASIGLSSFPRCLECGNMVRFISVARDFAGVPSICEDRDFRAGKSRQMSS